MSRNDEWRQEREGERELRRTLQLENEGAAGELLRRPPSRWLAEGCPME